MLCYNVVNKKLPSISYPAEKYWKHKLKVSRILEKLVILFVATNQDAMFVPAKDSAYLGSVAKKISFL